ncbi:hypothetical protein SAMN06298226_2737 [Nitrosovibrio sp. Nv4]|uniref:hypothetical protein n=1 Tax=Nitrosovibrio sp. Nv4 TaxID=1945880 RepID=UPI000BD962F5|nr:hypothetical protein [Nitrosovibrio sp. Nv4]SOD42398.1 hypothetical protein SAMN06298226_2737 [Nitrosovibrio sp. Nv4]
MSWLFSQALVAEYSAASSSDGEQSAQLNVMPTQHKFWRNDKTMEFSRLSQFGLTLNLLTESRGAELLMSYLEAFPARTLALQERAPESQESEADCGRKWRGSLAKYDPVSRSLKTAQLSLIEDLTGCSLTLPRWGLMRNGECYPQPMLVHPTCESESGLWQTLTADDAHDRVNGKWNSRGEPKLSAQVKLYPTICARDYRYPGKSRMERTGGKQGEVLPQVIGGPLNPTWAEWFMGWPIGWTEFDPSATGKFPYAQQQHSVCSQKEPELSES